MFKLFNAMLKIMLLYTSCRAVCTIYQVPLSLSCTPHNRDYIPAGLGSIIRLVKMQLSHLYNGTCESNNSYCECVCHMIKGIDSIYVHSDTFLFLFQRIDLARVSKQQLKYEVAQGTTWQGLVNSNYNELLGNFLRQQ